MAKQLERRLKNDSYAFGVKIPKGAEPLVGLAESIYLYYFYTHKIPIKSLVLLDTMITYWK